MKRFRIALIGSRALHTQKGHEDDIEFLHKLCYRLAEIGVQFTSGLCKDGLDAIAQTEFSRAVDHGRAFQSQFEVYVYGIKAIHNSKLPRKHLAVPLNSTIKRELFEIAKGLHGRWDNCDEYARLQHARNVHQILGYNLDNPVNAVVTWCVTDNYGNPIGGTATAIKLAIQHNIPVFNFYGADRKAVIANFHQFLKATLLHPYQRNFTLNLYKDVQKNN